MNPAPMEISDEQAEVAGLGIHWLRAGDAPVLYVHGVPTGSFDWIPFLERIGGVAPDLPGFGRSAKPGDFEYSIAGYDRFLEAFTAHTGLERFSLVVHDFGGVGACLRPALPGADREARAVHLPAAASRLPLAPHRARLAHPRHRRADDGLHDSLGSAARAAARPCRPRLGALRPGDTARDPQALPVRPAGAARALGARLGELRCPALILWPTADPYIGAEFGQRYRDALGGDAELELVSAGHWTWHERPELVERTASFLALPLASPTPCCAP